MDYTLPQLYKRTLDGRLQTWLIGVEGATIVTTFGQVGETLQTARKRIIIAGRGKETEAAEKAKREAKLRWETKKSSGYSGSIDSEENENRNN